MRGSLPFLFFFFLSKIPVYRQTAGANRWILFFCSDGFFLFHVVYLQCPVSSAFTNRACPFGNFLCYPSATYLLAWLFPLVALLRTPDFSASPFNVASSVPTFTPPHLRVRSSSSLIRFPCYVLILPFAFVFSPSSVSSSGLTRSVLLQVLV
jgi:hypothetical protein